VKTIILISCVKKKLSSRARARDLYVSPLFRLNIEYAHALKPDAIYILSALHGVVDLDTEVEPYELTLNTMKSPAIQAWAEGVLVQLGERTDFERDHFVFLAGQKYRKFLIPKLRSFEVPMEGLTIGRQLHYLSEKRRDSNL